MKLHDLVVPLHDHESERSGKRHREWVRQRLAVTDLGEALATEEAKRKAGRISAALTFMGLVAGTTARLGEAWKQWGPVIPDPSADAIGSYSPPRPVDTSGI